MKRVNDIYEYLQTLAPLELQLGFDNAGIQIGKLSNSVTRVLLALDVTSEVVSEAAELGAELIVSHHPLIFTPIKNITDDTLLRLAREDIAVISMHTNLDIAEGGVNDVLLSLFNAERVDYLDEDNCGRVGELAKELDLSEFLIECKAALKANGLRYYDAHRRVKRVAVMGGSGGDYVADAANKGCDTYITADIKHHQFLLAKELNINLIDADHYCTENPVIPAVAAKLQAAFPEVEFTVSKVHKQVAQFI